MTTIDVSDLTYRRLKEMALSRQIPLEQFLDQVAGVAVEQTVPKLTPGTAEWTAALQGWLAIHASRTVIADDSRDAIYGDEAD